MLWPKLRNVNMLKMIYTIIKDIEVIILKKFEQITVMIIITIIIIIIITYSNNNSRAVFN